MRSLRKSWHLGVILVAPLLAAACGTTGVFDADAYQTDVQLKYETMSLLDNATARYPAHRNAAEALLQKYAAAADKAALGGNAAIVQQWAGIRDPRGSSAGNVIELWKKSPLRPAQRAEKKRVIAAHFDHLICLEQKSTDCSQVGLEAAVTIARAIAPGPAPRRGGAVPTPAPDAGEQPPDSDAAPGEKQQ